MLNNVNNFLLSLFKKNKNNILVAALIDTASAIDLENSEKM